MKVFCYDIDWCVEAEDTDGDAIEATKIKGNLSDQMTVDVDDEEGIADALSDKSGWLVKSFKCKVVDDLPTLEVL